MPPRSVAINGRFLSARLSGVQRVAAELLKACDHNRAGQTAPAPWRLLTERAAGRDLSLTTITSSRIGLSTWQTWEQLELPGASRNEILLSLCNTAPLLHRRNVVMIHDAQVFTSPQSYSRAMREWYRVLLPALGRSALQVLTVSEFSKRQLVNHGVAAAERISVIPNGVDHFATVASNDSAVKRLRGAPFVVALANAQTHKNIDVLLRAFSDARLRDIDLVLVGAAGPGDFETPWGPNVVFAGSVTDAQIKGLMEIALCLAFPSLTEGFGLPPLEAMSVGCPALVAPCGALPETCGEAALYVTPDDAGAWADAIAGLAHDSGLGRRLGGLGRARAGQYRWRTSARSLLDLLDQF